MKLFTHEPTSDPKVFRVVDSKGDWTHYFKEGVYAPAVNHILDLGFTKGPEFAKYLKENSSSELEEKLEKAGARGDAIHQAIRRCLENKGAFDGAKDMVMTDDGPRLLTRDELRAFMAFANFWEVHDC